MYFVESNKHLATLPKTGFFCNDYEESKLLAFRPINMPFMESSVMSWCIQNFANKHKRFVDIGSHIGSWTMSLAPHFKYVHAFECNRHVFNVLCGNIALRGLSHSVSTHYCGLSKCKGIMKYYKRNPEGGPNGVEYLCDIDKECETEDIQVCSLDEFELTDIGLLKIDVEGHEKSVLEGALQTLKNNNYPPFMFESWSDQRSNVPASKLRNALFSYIESIGYRVVTLAGWDEMFLAEYNR